MKYSANRTAFWKSRIYDEPVCADVWDGVCRNGIDCE